MSLDRDGTPALTLIRAAHVNSGRTVGNSYLGITSGSPVIRPRPFSLRVQMVPLIQTAQTCSL
jgi:hypothetical protein